MCRCNMMKGKRCRCKMWRCKMCKCKRCRRKMWRCKMMKGTGCKCSTCRCTMCRCKMSRCKMGRCKMCKCKIWSCKMWRCKMCRCKLFRCKMCRCKLEVPSGKLLYIWSVGFAVLRRGVWSWCLVGVSVKHPIPWMDSWKSKPHTSFLVESKKTRGVLLKTYIPMSMKETELWLPPR